MSKLFVVAGAALALALAGAAPASSGEVCYDVDVVVNGAAVVDEAACTPVG